MFSPKITKQGTFANKMVFISNGVCTKRTHSFSGIVNVSAQIIIDGQHTKSYPDVRYSKAVYINLQDIVNRSKVTFQRSVQIISVFFSYCGQPFLNEDVN